MRMRMRWNETRMRRLRGRGRGREWDGTMEKGWRGGKEESGGKDGQGLAAEGISYVQHRRPASPSPSFSNRQCLDSSNHGYLHIAIIFPLAHSHVSGRPSPPFAD